MINLLADRVLEFERDRARTETAKTSIGFCSLPDWVAETDYFQLAKKAGIIKPFEGSSDKAMENVLKEKEYQDKIKELEARLAESEEQKAILAALDPRTVKKAAEKAGIKTDDSEESEEQQQPEGQ